MKLDCLPGGGGAVIFNDVFGTECEISSCGFVGAFVLDKEACPENKGADFVDVGFLCNLYFMLGCFCWLGNCCT